MPAPLILTRSQVRDVDRRAVEEYGIPGVVLMENAGRGAVDVLCGLNVSGPVVICAGTGNNGGDGFVMARHLAIRDIEPRVVLCGTIERLSKDAAINFRILEKSGISIRVLGEQPNMEELVRLLDPAECIVDALLGTGVDGLVRGPCLTGIQAINLANKPVLAVDVPSGMECDSGRICGVCVKANATATFVAKKPGFGAAGARRLTGDVHVVDIGVPPKLLLEIQGLS